MPSIDLKGQSNPKNRRKMVFKKIKLSSFAVYAGIFLFIIAMISVGYNEPQEISVLSTKNVNVLAPTNQTSVDDVVATGVAANIAKTINLPIATSVVNLAVSTQTKSDYIQSDNTIAVKPQIISTEAVNRSVVNYTVVEGDTVTSLAEKFKISSQTIKWANNLTSDSLKIDKVLRILPVDGVLYSVKTGDTIDSIAKKYETDKTQLVLFNDLEVSDVNVGQSIILPSANLPETERPGYVAPVVINYFASQGTGLGNGRTWRISIGTPDNGFYAYGNCTTYAYNRRVELGLPVGNNWGHAASWAANAAARGYSVNHTPTIGSIMQNSGGYGHVAIVESILENGDLSISEMNASYSGGGWNIVSGRIIPAGNISYYNYIH